MKTSVDFLLVGGGLASATALETLLKSGIAGKRITLIGAEQELPYNRPPLSKGYLLGREERSSVFVKPQTFYESAGVRLVLGTKVTAVDPASKTVTTDRGETFTYGKLLLAYGSTLRRLTVPGSDLPGIRYLRTLGDSDALKEAIARSKTGLVVGGSFIGMELASAFAQGGLHTTLLHRGKEIFDKLGSPEASAFFAQYYREHGVTIRTEDEATAFAPNPAGSGLKVTTKRGDTIAAEVVAVGVGVVPETALLNSSGITLDNGIVVNEYLEASVPDVYAAGDVANFFDPLYGRQRRIEHWDTAIQHGKVAGANMAVSDPARRVPYAAVSYFFSDVFDLSFEYFGDAAGTDRTIIRGSFQDRAVTVFSLEQATPRAAFTMGRPKERKVLRELLQTQRPLQNPDTLANLEAPLSPSPP